MSTSERSGAASRDRSRANAALDLLTAARRADAGLRRRAWLALAATVALAGGLGGWLATAQLSGALIATGKIVVDENIKKVQHPTGGIVGEIHVRNGDRVQAGQVVMRLDQTQTRALLGIVVSQLVELRARKARLTAERDGKAEIVFDASLDMADPAAAQAMAGERHLLQARRKSLVGQKDLLRERIKQLSMEGTGLNAQYRAKTTEFNLVREELARVQALFRQHLAPITQVLALLRDETRIDGERGSVASQIGRVGGQSAEVELQILNLDQSITADAQKELRDIEGRIAELEERRIAAEDQLRRIDIRAPRDGIVHELNVNTVGGVIGAAETLMMIVPTGEALSVEVQLAPQDIDQTMLGQVASLRFVAFNQRITPVGFGKVTRISPDLSRETQTGVQYYSARITIDEAATADLGGLTLLPGMPVEAYIETTTRTMLSYLVKPLSDHFQRAFRED